MNLKLQPPLYAKILGWFFLNLVLLGAGFYLLAVFQFHLSLDSLLAGRAGERIERLAKHVETELPLRSPSEWKETLARFGEDYGVQLFLVSEAGMQLSGEPIALPDEVNEKLPGLPGRPRLIHPGKDNRPPPDTIFDEDRPPPPSHRGESGKPGMLRPKFMLRAGEPSQYWVGVRVRIRERGLSPARPAILLAASESLSGGGLFFDSTPWMVAGFGAVLLSLLFWIPFVHGITRDLGRLTRATERIAEGQFELQTELRRGDELGRLGHAIHQMAQRLAGFVTGQKRFLGDIAHELCSPLARMEMALAILDQRANAAEREYVADVREEVHHMSELVNELLLFSKASLRGRETKLAPISLQEITLETIAREAPGAANITCEVPPDLQVMAESALLSRAIGNLIRNSLRYGGKDGPITVAAARDGNHAILTVSDCGPGVPAETLARLGEPFFRPDSARTREAGGTGLGLAIVRTCIDACQGSITFHNRAAGGLEARIQLQRHTQART